MIQDRTPDHTRAARFALDAMPYFSEMGNLARAYLDAVGRFEASLRRSVTPARYVTRTPGGAITLTDEQIAEWRKEERTR